MHSNGNMDPMKRKVLDECLLFLTQNMILTSGLYGSLIQSGVFTDDMLSKIKSYQTTEDQIVELVNKLKRRNNESFEHFLNALHGSSQGFIADYLSQQLRQLTDEGRRNSQHQDARDAQRPVRRESQHQVSHSNDDLTTLSKQELIGRIVRLNEQLQEFRDMEEDYFNLQCSYEHLLEDHQETVAQRDSLREAVFHLRVANDVERRFADTRKQRRLTDDELQRMIHEKDKELVAYRREREEIEDELRDIESRLSEAEDDRRRLAAELKLDDGASISQIIARVGDLRCSNNMNLDRIDRMEAELKQLKITNAALVKERDSLKAHNQKLEQKLQRIELQKRTYELQRRTYEPSGIDSRTPGNLTSRADAATDRTNGGTVTLTRINLSLRQSPVANEPLLYQRSRTIFTNESNLPSIGGGGGVAPSSQYCILCHQQCHGGGSGGAEAAARPRSAFSDHCRVHYRSFRAGRYECCLDPSATSTGCMTVKHLFVEVMDGACSGRTRIYTITDGCGFRVRADQRGYYGATCDRRRP